MAIDNPLTPGSIRSEYQSGRRQIPTVRDYLNIDPAISFGKKLTEPLTRAPGAYGKLDPGSLYGQVTQANKNGLNSPQSIELLAQVTADMFTPLSASTRTIKKAAEPSLEAVTRGAVKRIQDIRLKSTQKAFRAEFGNYARPEFQEAVQKTGDSLQIATPPGKKVNWIDYFRTPDRVMKKMGLEGEAKYLRRQWDGYIRELPQEIEKIRSWKKRTPDPTSSQRIFKYLDGDKGVRLIGEEIPVAKEIRAYLSEWADKLGLPEDKRITNYITHIWEQGKEGVEFPDEIANTIRDKIPGSVYDPFVTSRLGQRGYVEDVWQALGAYTKRATRKYKLDPALEAIKKRGESLEQSQFNYVKRETDRINMRPQEVDTLVDNWIKGSPLGYRLTERPTAHITKAARQMVYRGALGLNPASAIKNLTQGANTYAKLGEKYTIRGYIDMVKNWNTDELKRVGVLADEFIQDKNLPVTKQALDKLDTVLFSLFETAEKINRGAAYYGAKAQGLSRGMNERQAIEHAKDIVRTTQFSFGAIDTPVALQGDILKTIVQFQTYSLKQTEFLSGMIRDKDIAGLVRYTGASLAMIYFIGDMVGLTPKDMIPSFRFGWPPALKVAIEGGKAMLNTPDEYGNPRDLTEKLRDIGNAAVPYIPAGVQAKRTIEAVSAMREGASFTPSGKFRFEVKPSVKTAIFGIWRTPEAKKYLNKREGRGLSDVENEARTFEKTEDTAKSVDTRFATTVYLKLKNLETQEERKQLLDTLEQEGMLSNTVRREIARLGAAKTREADSNFAKAVRTISTNERRADFIARYFAKENDPVKRQQFLSELEEAGLLTDDLRKKIKSRGK